MEGRVKSLREEVKGSSLLPELDNPSVLGQSMRPLTNGKTIHRGHTEIV